MARRTTKPVTEIQATVAAVPTWFENKAKMINHVLICELDAKAKVLLLELIMRRDLQTGQLNPGTPRLAKARGIKDTKNFKGLETYLPGLVVVHKTPGKKNYYSLNDHAIMALPEAEVKLSGNNFSNHPSTAGYTGVTAIDYPSLEANPPSDEGYYPPSDEGYYPPSDEGSNSSVDSSVDSSSNNKGTTVTTLTREGENEVLPLAKTNTAFGGKVTSGKPKKEVLEIGFSPLADEVTANAAPSSASGSSLADVVEADASPTDSSGETKSPGYSSVTKKKYVWEVPKRNVHVDNEMVTVDQEATDASLSASGAEVEAKVPEIPAKPQKPVPSVPGRSQYDTDMSYQKKKDNAESAHLKAMGKWRQDLTIWENKYGDNPSVEEPTAPTPLSAEAQAKLDRYAKLQKHAY